MATMCAALPAHGVFVGCNAAALFFGDLVRSEKGIYGLGRPSFLVGVKSIACSVFHLSLFCRPAVWVKQDASRFSRCHTSPVSEIVLSASSLTSRCLDSLIGAHDTAHMVGFFLRKAAFMSPGFRVLR